LSGKYFGLILTLALAATVGIGCMPLPETAPAIGTTKASAGRDLPLFYAAYATPIEEPWDAVIHRALQQAAAGGKIRYQYADDIGYSGEMERVLREVAETRAPAAIFGDAYGNEEAVRRVAGDYPAIPFIFCSGLGRDETGLEHDADRGNRDRPDRCRLVHGPGSDGVQHDGQGRREPGAVPRQ
jgi:basic membrane lipoprotein Med (substrate-binding protein (PBP1-ABC) superfamily)